jgi:hypothetical protein
VRRRASLETAHSGTVAGDLRRRRIRKVFAPSSRRPLRFFRSCYADADNDGGSPWPIKNYDSKRPRNRKIWLRPLIAAKRRSNNFRKPGQKELTALGKSFQTLTKSAEVLKKEIGAGLTPVLSTFGLRAGTVVGSVIGLSVAMQKMARSALELHNTAAVLGLTAQQLHALKRVAAELGYAGGRMVLAGPERFF